MTEVLFSQNDNYTNVIARLEAAVSGKSVQDAHVSLTRTASKNGEVLYKATVSRDNGDGLSNKVLGLYRSATRHSGFLQNKADKPENKVANWNVFYQLLKNEAAQSVYEHTVDERQERFDEALSFISQFVYEEETSDQKGLKLSSLKNLSAHLNGQDTVADTPEIHDKAPRTTVEASGALLMSSVGFLLARDQMQLNRDVNFHVSSAGVGRRNLDDYLEARPSVPTDDTTPQGDGAHPTDALQPVTEVPFDDPYAVESSFDGMSEATATELSLQQSREMLDEKGEVETEGSDEGEVVGEEAYSRDKLKTKAAKITPVGEEVDIAEDGGHEIHVEDGLAGSEDDAVEREEQEARITKQQNKMLALDGDFRGGGTLSSRTAGGSMTTPAH